MLDKDIFAESRAPVYAELLTLDKDCLCRVAFFTKSDTR